MEERQPKISNIEAGLWVIVLSIGDAADLFSFGIPISDFLFPVLQYYLVTKGVPSGPSLGGNIAELFPGIDYLPLRTAGFLVVVYKDRHPGSLPALPGESLLDRASPANRLKLIQGLQAKYKGGESNEAPAEVGAEEESQVAEYQSEENSEQTLQELEQEIGIEKQDAAKDTESILSGEIPDSNKEEQV